MTSQPFLLTGVTGGLGGKVLEMMLQKHNIPAASITATSRSSSNREKFESQGLKFAVLDYNQPDTIVKALTGVENFLFVSASEFDNEKRRTMHQNVVDGAKAAGVKKTWYVSLAFGGFDVNEVVSVQQVHNWTEEMLIRSGLDFVSLRAGVYADAFPLFLNWYPDSKAIRFPQLEPSVHEGQLALTSREELGEGIAAIFGKGLQAYPSVKPRSERNIILLTTAQTATFVEIAEAINRAKPEKQIPIEFLKPDDWISNAVNTDMSGKSKAWFEARLVWFKEMCKGALRTTDSALEILIDRRPLDGVQMVEHLVSGHEGYTWHQNSSAALKK